MDGWVRFWKTSVNSVGLLTVSGLYWFRSRNFLRMKNSLCFPEFWKFPEFPQQKFASPSCPNWSSFSIHGISWQHQVWRKKVRGRWARKHFPDGRQQGQPATRQSNPVSSKVCLLHSELVSMRDQGSWLLLISTFKRSRALVASHRGQDATDKLHAHGYSVWELQCRMWPFKDC